MKFTMLLNSLYEDSKYKNEFVNCIRISRQKQYETELVFKVLRNGNTLHEYEQHN